MARFTKTDTLDELRTIFLFEADHIAIGKGPSFAEEFIGFPSGDKGEYLHLDTTLVDLSRFDIAGSFARGYEYAFQPSLLNSFGLHEGQNLLAFMMGTPRVGGQASAGEPHRFMTPNGFCQQVTDAVHARWKLDIDEGYSFTARELALLSDMTEGAVRNALADKGEGGLKAIPGSKPVSIDNAEAARWLSGRRGFVATPERPVDDRFLLENIKDAATAERLSNLLSIVIREQTRHREELCPAAGCSEAQLTSWCNGTFVFDHELAVRLATAIGIDVPVFVGKALETALRRDLGRTQ